MKHLFWNLNFLALSGVTNSNQLYYEARVLASELDAGWKYSQSELGTLCRKAQDYAEGKRIEWGGRQYAPLYTPKNDTLINLFSIQDAEQRKLRTIVSKEIAKERDRDRHKVRRRAGGAMDRETYLGAVQKKLEHAQRLSKEGISVRAIAQSLGVSVRSAHKYLNMNRGVQSPSVLLSGEA